MEISKEILKIARNNYIESVHTLQNAEDCFEDAIFNFNKKRGKIINLKKDKDFKNYAREIFEGDK